MNASITFTEILIIGIQASTWMGIVLHIYLRAQNINVDIAGFVDYSMIIFTFFLAWVYLIGVVVDRLCDMVFEKINKFFLRSKEIGSRHSFHLIVYEVLKNCNSERFQTIVYYRHRLRLLRSAIWNVPLVCLAGMVAFWPTGKVERVIIVLTATIICNVVFIAFRKMALQYIGLLKGFHGTEYPTPNKE